MRRSLARSLVPTLLTFVAVPALGAQPKPAPAAEPATPAPAASKPAASAPHARAEDVATPEAVVAALYDVISGPKGQARDWNRFRSLFAPGARMIPSGKRPDGVVSYHMLTPEEYIARSEKKLVEEGFREREISRVVERFGPLVHVFTTYEALREGEAKPFMRGINSIQLMHDGQRWWLLTVAWTPETPDQPLPAKYLSRPKG
ncbi:nuclear transport factor 2 family protein [Hyalangium rubrum]|uniref:Nuclear transport factor 2 family protein n=1 Tax=Hyalangium rubrum TaxID=3103134 RepID=A0ABU5H023_9BACT|nr:nuclear transport factor 2 family protein [Hyalangium sp. s54d21]MDY7226755.1 nuclear transport factor 2 family protein [Hyalangium sp. s54d21]